MREGEYGHDMYFIASGEVAVVTGPPGQHIEVCDATLRQGLLLTHSLPLRTLLRPLLRPPACPCHLLRSCRDPFRTLWRTPVRPSPVVCVCVRWACMVCMHR